MKACSLIDRLQRDQWLARGNWEKPMESTPLVAGSQVVVTGLSGGALELRKVYNNVSHPFTRADTGNRQERKQGLNRPQSMKNIVQFLFCLL